MMRLIWATMLASLVSAPLLAQQRPGNAAGGPAQAGNAQARGAESRSRQAAADAPGQAPERVEKGRPFPPLSAGAQAQLQQLLREWEKHSQSTKTLECQFQRWHYDMFAAKPGVHASKSTGVIKYAAPDKGLFRVDSKVFFNGMEEGEPQYAPQEGQFGEYWVCNGKELIEFDRSKEECRIQELPPGMRGEKIFNSPLPFVFNLDAKQIQQRYWVRQVAAPKPELVLIEAWPKRQEDRAQYRLVQIALQKETFLPQALLMYAPNFHAKNAPKWDHYEFTGVERNSIGQGMQMFLRNFISEKPPAHWKVLRDTFRAPAGPPQRSAEAPDRQQTPVR